MLILVNCLFLFFYSFELVMLFSFDLLLFYMMKFPNSSYNGKTHKKMRRNRSYEHVLENEKDENLMKKQGDVRL